MCLFVGVMDQWTSGLWRFLYFCVKNVPESGKSSSFVGVHGPLYLTVLIKKSGPVAVATLNRTDCLTQKMYITSVSIHLYIYM